MPLNIIYLDDEPDLCEIFSDELSSENILIKTFTDPALAIAEASRNPPDIIFLDYRLPGTTGDEIARNMASDIPKYLITGDLAVKTDYGFVKVFLKPCNYDKIRSVLVSQLQAAQISAVDSSPTDA